MKFKSFLQCLSLGVLTLCFGSISAQSQNANCVGPSATGNGSGSDWNNIKIWGSGPSRGDVWYLEGGTYSGQTFNVAASGNSYITIKKATTADHFTDTGWNNATMSTQAVFNSTCTFLTSYWIFDGQLPQNTNWDGNPGDYGFKFVDNSCNDIHIGPSGSGTVSNYVFAHFAAKGYTGDPASGCPAGANFCISTTSGSSEVDFVTITNCLMDCWQNDIATTAAVNKNWTIQGNVFFGTMYYSDAHCENISENYGQDQNITVCNNLFYNNTNVTGCIVVALNGGPSSNWFIYGNVFYHDITTGNGIICTGSGNETATGVHIYNNTFDSCTIPWLGNIDATSVLTGDAANNLFYNMNAGGPPSGFGTVDYSAYYSCSGNNGDAHIQSSSGNPFVSDSGFNFELVSNTIPGANLGPPYNIDPTGNTRTTWTRGAYEYVSQSTQEPVISNIASIPMSTNALAITWTTDENANSIVDYGTTTSYGTSVTNSSMVTAHSITISNLNTQIRNYFQVRSIDSLNRMNSSGNQSIPMALMNF